jgi:hypothetical protein
MRRSTAVGLVVGVAAGFSLFGGGAIANGATVCAWGGTPAAPTGWFTLNPGATNTPSAEPLKLRATGPLSGGGACEGKVTFEGIADAGATCPFLVFAGEVKGLPGVARFWGPAPPGVAQEFLYDDAGNVVGSDQPQVLTNETEGNSPLMGCDTPQGLRSGNFSATLELLAP